LRLPRDLTGAQLGRLLRRYGYEISRQTGSHIRLTTTVMGAEHHVTIPAHRNLKLGTLASIVTEVAVYLKKDREDLADELFS
jgi:predicted RNA binding protein YcfA (HicA-like mRNA interferase family)